MTTAEKNFVFQGTMKEPEDRLELLFNAHVRGTMEKRFDCSVHVICVCM